MQCLIKDTLSNECLKEDYLLNAPMEELIDGEWVEVSFERKQQILTDLEELPF